MHDNIERTHAFSLRLASDWPVIAAVALLWPDEVGGMSVAAEPKMAAMQLQHVPLCWHDFTAVQRTASTTACMNEERRQPGLPSSKEN